MLPITDFRVIQHCLKVTKIHCSRQTKILNHKTMKRIYGT